ncbi:hypothetical protein, partial [Klebsiella variicola]|uniref:hypothetical protein n=1 Tax=Klebsiella variicola TaxID=244366 RepID=UPI001955BE91
TQPNPTQPNPTQPNTTQPNAPPPIPNIQSPTIPPTLTHHHSHIFQKVLANAFLLFTHSAVKY